MPDSHLAGSCLAHYVVDVGRGIDLARAVRLLRETRTPSFQHKSGIPFRQSTPPARLSWDVTPRILGRFETTTSVEVSLYAQGVVCVVWEIPFESEMRELADLSAQLYDHAELTAESRAIAGELARSIGDALDRPGTTGLVEDYVVFQVVPVADVARFLDVQRVSLAQLLRAEHRALAEQEIDDATAGPVSYERDDLCLVDWLAAFLMGDDTSDELLVLEYATVDLLLLRGLDARLDEGIEQANALLSRAGSPLAAFTGQARELQQIARLQADGARLHEGLDNALKLFGDDYLARLYRSAARRFHFEGWSRTIQRKLAVLRNVYESLADVAAHRRAEGLEWIIIVLIAVDIAIYAL